MTLQGERFKLVIRNRDGDSKLGTHTVWLWAVELPDFIKTLQADVAPFLEKLERIKQSNLERHEGAKRRHQEGRVRDFKKARHERLESMDRRARSSAEAPTATAHEPDPNTPSTSRSHPSGHEDKGKQHKTPPVALKYDSVIQGGDGDSSDDFSKYKGTSSVDIRSFCAKDNFLVWRDWRRFLLICCDLVLFLCLFL